jgi:hypothetical protein
MNSFDFAEPSLRREALRRSAFKLLGYVESAFQKLGENRSHHMRVPVGHGAPSLAGFTIEHDVSVDYAQRVASVRNDGVRNLLITQAYHDLSREMARVLGVFHMNWCTIACWASKRAGKTIRGEDLAGQRAIVGVLERVPVARRLADIASEITSTIAVGNREVFEEVAPAFASFLETFRHDRAPDAVKLEAWSERFAKGAPEAGGQDPLRRAFELYHRARFETDLDRQAELVHAANIYVALQEQTRLQARIAAGMPGGSSYLITKVMLTLDVGATVSHRLGYDLPVDAPFGRYLETIEDEELAELIARFDPDPSSTRGTGAHRWDRLEDRMHFIVDLFRLHASDAQLFAAPFTVSEWAGLSRRIAREA